MFLVLEERERNFNQISLQLKFGFSTKKIKSSETWLGLGEVDNNHILHGNLGRPWPGVARPGLEG